MKRLVDREGFITVCEFGGNAKPSIYAQWTQWANMNDILEWFELAKGNDRHCHLLMSRLTEVQDVKTIEEAIGEQDGN